MKQAACVLIYRADGTILVVGRRHDPNQVCLPGGKRDPGENLMTCAVRELQEETGLCVPADRLVPLMTGPCESEPGGVADYEVAVFAVAWDEDFGLPQTQEANVVPRWMAPERLVTHGAMPIFNRLVVQVFRAWQLAHAAERNPR